MSVCGQTEEDSTSEEAGAPARDIYEQKAVSKVVRVLTVLAYLLSVSLAAILLSVYYICVWKSPELPPLNDTGVKLSARRADNDHHLRFTDQSSSFVETTGRGNSTVKNIITQPPPSNSTNDSLEETSAPHVSTEQLQDLRAPPNTTLQNAYNGTSDDIGTLNQTSIT